jgi:hypothetical protein
MTIGWLKANLTIRQWEGLARFHELPQNGSFEGDTMG